MSKARREELETPDTVRYLKDHIVDFKTIEKEKSLETQFLNEDGANGYRDLPF